MEGATPTPNSSTPLPSSSPAPSTAPNSGLAATAARQWTREQVRRALNDRYLLVRRLERAGLRRGLMAVGIFVGEFDLERAARSV